MSTTNAPESRSPHLATEGADEWMTGKAAASTLGISRKLLARLGAERKLTRRQVPGSAPKFLRADVLALAERSTTPAADDAV